MELFGTTALIVWWWEPATRWFDESYKTLTRTERFDWQREWKCEQNISQAQEANWLNSMENPGFDPGACRLQSDRSSDWASPPWYHCISCSSNKQVSSPTAGIEPATIWLKGQRSTSWATEALINARQSVITCSQILVHEMGFEPTHPKMLRPERTCFDRSATCCALNWWLIHSTVQHSLTHANLKLTVCVHTVDSFITEPSKNIYLLAPKGYKYGYLSVLSAQNRNRIQQQAKQSKESKGLKGKVWVETSNQSTRIGKGG